MKPIATIILVLSLGACKSSETPCYSESLTEMDHNPVETVDWLQDLKARLSSSDAYIALYNWGEESYFYVYMETPIESNDFAQVTIYKSDGSVYVYCGGNSDPNQQNLCDLFNGEAIFIVKLWDNKGCK